MRSIIGVTLAILLLEPLPAMACGGEARGPNQHREFFIHSLQRDALTLGMQNAITLEVHPCPIFGRHLIVWPFIFTANEPLRVMTTPAILSLDTHALERVGRELLCWLRLSRIPNTSALWSSGVSMNEAMERCYYEFDGHDPKDTDERTAWLLRIFPFEHLFRNAFIGNQ